MSSNGVPGPSKATARTWLGLAVIAIPCLIYAMDLTVLNLAVPAISAELKPSAAELLWIVDIYGFMVAGFLVTMGTLGDRIGRRRLLMIGASAFAVASVLVALSSSAEMLIAARAIQGIAGATLAPSTLSLIRNMFLDDRQRTLAIGIWVASFSAGAALGPVFGGVILEHFPWGTIFLVNVPVMLVLLAAAPLLLPEFRDPNAGRLDPVSAVQSLAAVLSVTYGLKRMAEGAGLMECAVAVSVGLVAGAMFVGRQRRLADPLIDLSLFSVPGFGAALAVNILGLFTVFATFLFIAQHMQIVLGMGPLESGLWLAPSGLVFALGSVLTPALLKRMSRAGVLVAGFVVAAVGFVILTRLALDPGLTTLFAGMVVMCIGLAPVGTITTDIVMSAAPPERAGAASAISETSFELGAAAGIAVLGSLFAAIYRSELAENLSTGLPADAVASAGMGLANALSAAAALGAPEGPNLKASALAAFTTAFVTTSALAALCSLGAAVLSAGFLGRGRASR